MKDLGKEMHMAMALYRGRLSLANSVIHIHYRLQNIDKFEKLNDSHLGCKLD